MLTPPCGGAIGPSRTRGPPLRNLAPRTPSLDPSEPAPPTQSRSSLGQSSSFRRSSCGPGADLEGSTSSTMESGSKMAPPRCSSALSISQEGPRGARCGCRRGRTSRRALPPGRRGLTSPRATDGMSTAAYAWRRQPPGPPQEPCFSSVHAMMRARSARGGVRRTLNGGRRPPRTRARGPEISLARSKITPRRS